MNVLQRRIQLDLNDLEGVDLDLDELSTSGDAVRSVASGTRRAHGTEHELKRRQFANGPGAYSAAHMLEQALGLTSATAVTAGLERRALRRVDYRYDRSDVARGSRTTERDARSGIENRSGTPWRKPWHAERKVAR